jgi:hypothetical protein
MMDKFYVQNAHTGHVMVATPNEARFWASLDWLEFPESDSAYNVLRQGGSGLPLLLVEI